MAVPREYAFAIAYSVRLSGQPTARRLVIARLYPGTPPFSCRSIIRDPAICSEPKTVSAAWSVGGGGAGALPISVSGVGALVIPAMPVIVSTAGGTAEDGHGLPISIPAMDDMSWEGVGAVEIGCSEFVGAIGVITIPRILAILSGEGAIDVGLALIRE